MSQFSIADFLYTNLIGPRLCSSRKGLQKRSNGLPWTLSNDVLIVIDELNKLTFRGIGNFRWWWGVRWG
ncbi:hypothetical protein HanHA300_Chr07g0229121 [Helianthus annuus]|nr:hypothetical protein HanHA300_Chr07g0229121 [Helianthus annuus]KAJ0561991.1 hypothetical protein HanHA89_Chr07g0246141 [Helianthus annuus]KAJ0727385.1 hypothetical protein HanLR1_Chr07g0229141 [Helianthus annuus]